MNQWNIPETLVFWISDGMLRILKSESGLNIFFSLWIQFYTCKIDIIWIFSRVMVARISK